MEASFRRFYLVLQCFADGFNILSLCTDLFRKKKSKPTTKKIANKQNQPNKQEKTLTNFFLPRCRFFYLCFAEDLSSEESCRRLVSDAVWQRLKYYFPAACEFTSVHSVCRLCQVRPDSFEPSFWLITTPRMRVA